MPSKHRAQTQSCELLVLIACGCSRRSLLASNTHCHFLVLWFSSLLFYFVRTSWCEQVGGGSVEGGLAAVHANDQAMRELVTLLDVDAKVRPSSL
jgi:hypothetical protein